MKAKVWQAIKEITFPLKIIIGCLLILLIVITVFPLVPPFKGYFHSRTVLTGSMEPAIRKGSVIINQLTGQKNLRVGDVITFQKVVNQTPSFVTHRIVKIDKSSVLYAFETKGDANPIPDAGKIGNTTIEGKVVVVIPFLGYLITFFKTLPGFALLVILPLSILLISQVVDFNKTLNNIKEPPKIVAAFLCLLLLGSIPASKVLAYFKTNSVSLRGIELQTASHFKRHDEFCLIRDDHDWLEFKNDSGHSSDLFDWVGHVFTKEDDRSEILPGQAIQADDHVFLYRYSRNDRNDNSDWQRWFDGLRDHRKCKEEPWIDLSRGDKDLKFDVSGVANFKSLSYTLTYDTDAAVQGVEGNVELAPDETQVNKDIVLGTCSSGDCVYQQGVKNIQLHVTLQDQNNNEFQLDKSL